MNSGADVAAQDDDLPRRHLGPARVGREPLRAHRHGVSLARGALPGQPGIERAAEPVERLGRRLRVVGEPRYDRVIAVGDRDVDVARAARARLAHEIERTLDRELQRPRHAAARDRRRRARATSRCTARRSAQSPCCRRRSRTPRRRRSRAACGARAESRRCRRCACRDSGANGTDGSSPRSRRSTASRRARARARSRSLRRARDFGGCDCSTPA